MQMSANSWSAYPSKENLKPCSIVSIFQGFTSQQTSLVEDNSVLIEQREKEIQHIVSSIVDLNEIFQDLSALIVEQVRIFLY
jgi:hypothetical protein